MVKKKSDIINYWLIKWMNGLMVFMVYELNDWVVDINRCL